MLRGLSTTEAQAQLAFIPGKSAEIVNKVLKSAVANAKHNYEMDESTLTVADINIDGGIVLKRHNPASRGMAHAIIKRMAHVEVIVEGKASLKEGKKAEIDTISADEYVTRKESVEEQEVTETPLEKKDTEKRPVQDTQDKKEGEAFQKSKMNQQGGDKTKTHRRKSM